MKHSTNALQYVPETLLYTLYMKYRESKRPSGKIQDPRYEEIISKIDYDFSRFDDISENDSLFQACRTILFDQITRAYIEKNPDAVIVSFGSGLDFRFERLDNGRIQWFDIELPEVVELRKKIFQETDRVHSIPVSVLDRSWADCIPLHKNIFFIAEGLLMYFTPEQVREVFIHLSENFSGSTLLLEVYTSRFLEISKLNTNSFMSNMVDMWQWTPDTWNDIEKWDPRIRVIDEWMPMNLFGDREPSFADEFFQCRIGLVQLGENK